VTATLALQRTDSVGLADWLELWALLQADQNSSAGDLETALSREGSAASDALPAEAQRIEVLVRDVFSELRDREIAAGDGYPFVVDRGVLRLKSDAWSSCSAYLFCLCLSSRRGLNHPAGRARPERAFEALCTEVARRFVGGQAVRFGAPRVAGEIDRGFARAVDALLKTHIREGFGFKALLGSISWQKDGGLDIVAWRDESDGRAGKLLLFGACASGHDWQDKLTDLRPEEWKSRWILGPLVSQILKVFFVPHRVSPEKWDDVSITAGMVFDRCRVARWCPNLSPHPQHGDGVQWARAQILRLSTAV
jgi:hypothetical protein